MNRQFKLCSYFFLAYLVKLLNALPALYCNFPLNRSDCGGHPTPVFSYYKPGSRCEIEIWRGCPSYNRFESEITCSHYCIARIMSSVEAEDSEENEIEVPDSVSCEGKLHEGDCGSQTVLVYTFNKMTETCEKGKWRGCTSSNIFSTKAKCEDLCKVDTSQWVNEMEKLSLNEVENMSKIFDQFLDSTVRPEYELLTTLLPEASTTPLPEDSTTPLPDDSTTPLPEASTTPLTETSTSPLTEVSTNSLTEVSTNPLPEASTTPLLETATTPQTEVTTNSLPEASTTPLPEAPTEPDYDSSSEKSGIPIGMNLTDTQRRI